ncbi:MAG: hypothetical protein CMO07_16990 [Thalassospira sp.]|nr:NHL repeat-containing protein [Thalassospira sp. UBA4513]MBE72366.1 hypothetical protein [Thalassospira sp.]|tara:strand:- start:455 stop:1312 length:858 start_codon:yes stop_codon:yes gene_type:complete
MDLHCIFRFDAKLEYFQWLDNVAGWSSPVEVLNGRVQSHKRRKPLDFNGPHSIAVAADGAMFVTTYYDPGVIMLSSEGSLLKVWGRGEDNEPTLAGPATGVLGANGLLWVTEYRLNAVFAYDTYTMSLKGALGGGRPGFRESEGFMPGSGACFFDRPHMARTDHEGNLIVVDTWNHRLQKFSPDGEFIGCLGGEKKGWVRTAKSVEASKSLGAFYAPVSISFDSHANLVVTDWGNSRLQWFDAEGRFVADDYSLPLENPYDAQIFDGRCVVANSAKGEVYVKSLL